MFIDRTDAGSKLAQRLTNYMGIKGVLVLALPRGGVVTGFEIARSLHARLDVLIVRKIGAPRQPELAAGAISETGTVVLNPDVVSGYGISKDYIEDAIIRQKEEIARRSKLYRKGGSISNIKGKIIILVDDGVATGATMKAAIETLKKEKIKKLVVALPVAPPETANELKKMVDEFICLETPPYFVAVGNYYQDFTQVSDEEVVRLIEKSQAGEEENDREEHI
jgi:putative phosphoribosyl transferase